jgi:class 3 adenylate cyclase
VGRRALGAVSVVWLAVLVNVALRHPHFDPDPQPLVRAFRTERAAGEPVYLFAAGLPAWAFYATDWGRPDTAALRWLARVAGPAGPGFGNAVRETHAVRGEGAGLVAPVQGEPTVVGVATGMQLRNATLVRPEPDSGWAVNEAARIRAAAHPCAWLFLEAYWGWEPLRELEAALVRAHGARIEERRSGQALLWRYRFR